MIVTKKALHRRTVLRGAAATLALPLLDAMVPAATAIAKTAARPVYRFGVYYAPCGMAMAYWTPKNDGQVGTFGVTSDASGSDLEITPILKPLERFKHQMLLLSGIDGIGGHARGSTGFLSGAAGNKSEYVIRAGTSADQVIAQRFAKDTQLTSLELGIDSRDVSGACDVGFACVYVNTISWRTDTTPLPMENNPRSVFERLFGDSGSTDVRARMARTGEQRSLLDEVMNSLTKLARDLGPADRARLTEYTDSVRDVERRIQRAEEQRDREVPLVDQPAGVPSSYEEHVKLMFDLQLLAFQSDLTRVSSYMLARELTGRSYPEIGVTGGHHPLSHHQKDRNNYENLMKINVWHTTLFAYMLEKMRATPDGDGTLLDHSALLYGAGMSDSDTHSPVNAPHLLVGGGVREKMGRHLVYAPGTKNSALLHALIAKFSDAPVGQFGGSTEPLSFT